MNGIIAARGRFPHRLRGEVEEELVVEANLGRDLDAEDLAVGRFLGCSGIVETEVFDGAFYDAGGFSDDEVFLAVCDGTSCGDFGDAEFVVEVGDAAGLDFDARGFAAVGTRPALFAAEVVAG